eukprot:scaffold1138_cov128-Cylindrotheca_fusiformis.AAC.24
MVLAKVCFGSLAIGRALVPEPASSLVATTEKTNIFERWSTTPITKFRLLRMRGFLSSRYKQSFYLLLRQEVALYDAVDIGLFVLLVTRSDTTASSFTANV